VQNSKISSFTIKEPIDPEGGAVSLSAVELGKYKLPNFLVFNPLTHKFIVTDTKKTAVRKYVILLEA
jgi:hypothetical protein